MSLFDGQTPSFNPFEASSVSQQDPRKFVVKHCDSLQAVRRMQLERSRRTGFIAGLDKVAGIEGLGVIQEGLSTIVKATGVGGQEWERIVDGGVEGVMSTVLGNQATNIFTGAMEKINPGAVNKGVSTAKQILDKVKDGDFNWRDIPQYTADFKNLWTLGKMVVDPFLGSNGSSAEPRVQCSASPYAMDLVAQGVKFKFLFVVEFNFYPQYQQLLDVEPSFVVKTAERPTINYEYEDMNLYNFKTKVIKRASFTPVNMTFHDDEQNRAVAFYNALMRIMSPVTNHASSYMYENSGMDFSEGQAKTVGKDSPTQGVDVFTHAASIGPLAGNCTSIIESINLYHVYMGGQKVNRYTFHRPRILNMSLDAFDMTSGDTTELKLEFAFDNIEIVNNDIAAMPMAGRDRADGSLYPLGGFATANGDYSSKETTKGTTKGTMMGGALGEAFSRGESFIDRGLGTISNWVSGAVDSVSGAVDSVSGMFTGGDKAKSFAAPKNAPLDISPVQSNVERFANGKPR